MKQRTNSVSRAGRLCGLFLVGCLLLAPAILQAREIAESEVRRAVQTWVRSVTANARPDATVERMEPHRIDGQTVAYIAYLAGGGFCLCGADDLVLPVYFYNPRGTYDPQNPNYQYILWEIDSRLKNLQEGSQKGDPQFYSYQETLSDRETFWQDLVAGRVPRSMDRPKAPYKDTEPDSMSLELTCHWQQGSPYNDQCPELTPQEDEHTLVGSDAVAIAQIMYYWQWPHTGWGTGKVEYEYKWSADWEEEDLDDNPGIPPDSIWEDRLEWVDGAGKDDEAVLRMKGYWDESLYDEAININQDEDYRDALEDLWSDLTDGSTSCHADFSATSYDWSIMEDTHSDPPDAADAEVAKLCYHAGVSIGRNYGVMQSAACTPHVHNALKTHFLYDHDAQLGLRDIAKMTEEIQWSRPVPLVGLNAEGDAHAWVVYGYNKRTDPYRQFLVNMGWGGDDDGWYTCDGMAWSVHQQHVTQIAPQDVIGFVGGLNHGDGSPNNPYEDIEEALAEAPDYVTLIFKAGTDMTFAADTLVIDRPMVLKGKVVIIGE